jgi:tRNA threonylcarbamoyladenosine biosynthesis protein TsaB
MRVLALETSGKYGALAALSGCDDGPPRVEGEVHLPRDRRTAVSLVPSIGRLLAQCMWETHSVDLVCVATGPGSFTGLRIGVTTAKTFAYASGARLVGAHTLAVLARAQGVYGPANLPKPKGRLWVILDAQRRELFIAEYACSEKFSEDGEFSLPGAWEPETSIQEVEAWLRRLQPGDMVVGPPLEKLAARLPEGVVSMPRSQWQPSAVAVGQLGIARFEHTGPDDPIQLVPKYFRKSAAEEKAESGEQEVQASEDMSRRR